MAEITYTPPTLWDGYSDMVRPKSPKLLEDTKPDLNPVKATQKTTSTFPQTRVSVMIIGGDVVTIIHDNQTGVKLGQDPSYVAAAYGDTNEHLKPTNTLKESF